MCIFHCNGNTSICSVIAGRHIPGISVCVVYVEALDAPSYVSGNVPREHHMCVVERADLKVLHSMIHSSCINVKSSSNDGIYKLLGAGGKHCF